MLRCLPLRPRPHLNRRLPQRQRSLSLLLLQRLLRMPMQMPGAKLFKSVGCIACHSIHGAGGSVGPELSGERSKGRDRAWLVRQIRDPKVRQSELHHACLHHAFGRTGE